MHVESRCFEIHHKNVTQSQEIKPMWGTFVVTVSVSLLSITIDSSSQSLKAHRIMACGAHCSTVVVVNSFPTRHQLMYNNKATWPSSCSARRSLFWFKRLWMCAITACIAQYWIWTYALGGTHTDTFMQIRCVKPLLLKRHSFSWQI